MNEPGRLPGGDARSRFLTELPARTQALTALAFRFAEDRDAWAKRRELQLGLEALERAAEAAGELMIAEHAREALACLAICEQSEQETPTHIVAELQMLVSALPWLALSDHPLPLDGSSQPPVSMPVPATAQAGAGSQARRPRGSARAATSRPAQARYSTTVPSRSAPRTKSWEQTGTRRRPEIDYDSLPEDEVWAPIPEVKERGVKESGSRPRTNLPPGSSGDRYSDPFVLSSAVDEAEFELSDGPVVLTQTVSGLTAPSLVRTVLVIDRPDVVAQVRAALDRKHYDVVGAFDGEEALLLLPSVEPDVVLVGQGLLEQADAQLVLRLRQDPDSAVAHVFLLGQSGPHMAAELGCDAWVGTPIAKEVLNAQLEEVLGDPRPDASRLEQLTEGTVDDIAAGVAEEIRRGLVQSLRAGREERIVLDDREELMAAAWTAIGRVRSHLAQRAGGRVQFAQPADESAHNHAGGVRGETASELAGRRVLVADDDPAVLWFFAGLLRDAHADVLEAKNGREALILAREHRPELVISDILMPKLDGFALCRELKRDAALWDVPVILLSWKEDFLLRMRELDCGAVGFLRKEAGGEQILDTVRQVLRPWSRLASHLRSPREVHGRIEQVGVYSLLTTVAECRADARVTVRDVFNIYEIGLREGQHVSAHRTAADGSFARGPVVLQALLGVRSGRFSVEVAEGPLRSALSAPLPAAMLEAVRRLNALLKAVSAPRTLRIAKVLFDNRTLLALSEASPPALTTFVRTLLKEDTPLRDRVLSGELDREEVETQLRELARLGAISAVWDVQGADLIADAYNAQLTNAVSMPPQAPEHPSTPPPPSRTGYRGELAIVPSLPPAPASSPAELGYADQVSADIEEEVRGRAPSAGDRSGVDETTEDFAEDMLDPSWQTDGPDTFVEPERDLQDVQDAEEIEALAALEQRASQPAADRAAADGGQHDENAAPVAMVPPAAVSAHTLPPFLTATGSRRALTLAGLGEPTRDPLDATGAFELLAAESDRSVDSASASAQGVDSGSQCAAATSADPQGDRWDEDDAPTARGSEGNARAEHEDGDVAVDGFDEGLTVAGEEDDASSAVREGVVLGGEAQGEIHEPIAAERTSADGSQVDGTQDSSPVVSKTGTPPPLPSQRGGPITPPDDLSGLRPAVRTPAPGRWPKPAGRVGPVLVRILALVVTLLIGAALVAVLWSLRGSSLFSRFSSGEQTELAERAEQAAVDSTADTSSLADERPIPRRTVSPAVEVEAKVAPTSAPTSAKLPSSAPSSTPAQQATPPASSGTLPYIDTSYGVDVTDDEGLLVIRFDADGTPPSVRIGDRDLGLAPTAVALPAGRHEVVFRRSGQTRFRYLVIRRGQTRVVDVP